MEDYLKTIYILSRKKDVHGADIARAIGVSRPTVCVSLKALEAEGYILMDDAREVHLTVGLVIPFVTSRVSREAGMRFRRDSGNLSGFVLDSLRGLSETLQYGQGEKRLARIKFYDTGKPSSESRSGSSNILIAYFSIPENVKTTDAVVGASIVVRDSEKMGNTGYCLFVVQVPAYAFMM